MAASKIPKTYLDRALDWWANWFERDYSWAGLKDKPWRGWVVVDEDRCLPKEDAPENATVREATLQDYWRAAPDADWALRDLGEPGEADSQAELVELSDTVWHRAHLPTATREGARSWKADPREERFEAHWARLQADLKARLEQGFGPEVYEEDQEGADRRAQLDGVIINVLPLSCENEQSPVHLSMMHSAHLRGITARKTHFGGDADFSSASFGGVADFSSASFGDDVDFSSASFGGDARFHSASFGGDARFHSASFSGFATFNGAGFDGSTIFESVSFGGSAIFESASFGGVAHFYGASFGGYAWFRHTAFGSVAWFERSNFRGNVDFYSASFGDNANFERVQIDGYASFERAKFYGFGWFEQARFGSLVRFGGATFSSDVGFENAVFCGNAWFERSNYGGSANFMSACFGGYASFQRVSFDSSALFVSASYGGNTNFVGATFGGYASFEGASFSGYASFMGASFDGYVRFKSVLFLGDAFFQLGRAPAQMAGRLVQGADNGNPIKALSEKPLDTEYSLVLTHSAAKRETGAFQSFDFSGGWALGTLDFSDRVFAEAPSFATAQFAGPTAFFRAELHDGVTLLGARFRYDDGATAISWRELVEKLATRPGFRDSNGSCAVPDETALKTAWLCHKGKGCEGLERTNLFWRAAFIAWRQYALHLPRADRLHDPTGLNWRDSSRNNRLEAAARDAPRFEQAYRSLKLLMGKMGDHLEEQRFFACELRARQARRPGTRSDIKFGEPSVAALYGIVADYGRSFLRPLAGLALIWLLSCFVYVGLWQAAPISREEAVLQVSRPGLNEPYETKGLGARIRSGFEWVGMSWNRALANAGPLVFAAEITLAPVANPVRHHPWAMALNEAGEGWSAAFSFVRLIHRMLAIPLLFLFALSLRRRFQLG